MIIMYSHLVELENFIDKSLKRINQQTESSTNGQLSVASDVNGVKSFGWSTGPIMA